jgi:Zn-dependent protease
MFGIGVGRRYRLFQLFGFPVYAEPSILILLVLFLLNGRGTAQGTLVMLVYALVAFFSIIVHELGHAFMVRSRRLGESVIVLHGLGGVTQWRGNAANKDRILIALAGPAASLVLGGLTYLIVVLVGAPNELFSGAAVSALIYVNIVWSIFNLMPIWPLDGGHVVRAALGYRRRAQRDNDVSLQVSMVAAGILLAIAISLTEVFVAVLLGLIVWSNYQEAQRLKGPPPSFYGY